MENLKDVGEAINSIISDNQTPCEYMFRRPGFIERVEGKTELIKVQPVASDLERRPGIIERVDAAMSKTNVEDVETESTETKSTENKSTVNMCYLS